MSVGTSHEHHHIVGGGIAGLATAIFMVRGAAVNGKDAPIFEQLSVAGGSLDGSGDTEIGYLGRGSRSFKEHLPVLSTC